MSDKVASKFQAPSELQKNEPSPEKSGREEPDQSISIPSEPEYSPTRADGGEIEVRLTSETSVDVTPSFWADII
jgi:hypothetical protein